MEDNRIKSIDTGSPLLGKAEIGDVLVSINGNRIIDVLDYKFFAYDRSLKVILRRCDGTEYSVHVSKPEGGDLGLDFESYLMDSPHSCANACIFCFIDQLPKGMRKTMYFKDDDTRLSFLLGNYITLTNLSEREIQRIIDLHISPVNISVHTTDPELRRFMLRNRRAGECMDIMKRFAAGGVVMNCQVVCCPGYNDGEVLSRTMRDLAELYPQVNSVSIVPVGLTKFREGLTKLRPFSPEHAARTIDLVTEFGEKCLERLGSRIFWCGDEMYIKAGKEIPDDLFYEEYAQLENGVGMIRLMHTEFSSALKLSDDPGKQSFSIACGESVEDLFKKIVCSAHEKYDTIKGQVFSIRNDFFGHSINVSGLITGQDLIRQLKGRELGDRLLISNNMIRREERDFLDDITIEQVSEELGVPVWPVEQDGFALWDAMCGIRSDGTELRPERPGADEDFYVYN